MRRWSLIGVVLVCAGACGSQATSVGDGVAVAGAALAVPAGDSAFFVVRGADAGLDQELVFVDDEGDRSILTAAFIQSVSVSPAGVTVVASEAGGVDVVYLIDRGSQDPIELLRVDGRVRDLVDASASVDGRVIAVVERARPGFDGPAIVEVFDRKARTWARVAAPEEVTTGAQLIFDNDRLYVGLPDDTACSILALPIDALDAATCVVARSDLADVLRASSAELVWLLDVCDGEPVIAVNDPPRAAEFTLARVVDGGVAAGKRLQGQVPAGSCLLGGVAIRAAGTDGAVLAQFELDADQQM